MSLSSNTNIIATEEFSMWLFHCIVISREANIFHQLRQVDFLTGGLCPLFYWLILMKFDLRSSCSFEVMLLDGDCQDRIVSDMNAVKFVHNLTMGCVCGREFITIDDRNFNICGRLGEG